MHASINSMMIKIWKKLASKKYRHAFADAHISNTVASQILLLREANKWTQQKLAEKAGMRQSRISNLEDPNYENIEIGTLKKLAAAFDVALSVRFVPFSDLARWSATLSPSTLLVPEFSQDSLAEAAGPSKPMVGSKTEDRVSVPMVSTDYNRSSLVEFSSAVSEGVRIHG